MKNKFDSIKENWSGNLKIPRPGTKQDKIYETSEEYLK